MGDKVKVQFEIDEKLALRAIRALENQTEKFARTTKKSFAEATASVSKLDRKFDVFVGNLLASGVTRIISGITDGFTEAFQAASRFETGLTDVAKTSNLTEKELAGLGKEIDKLTKIIPVTSQELLKTSKVAGQLGVEGAKNILKYAATISKLGKVSDLEGEAAASTLARILNITREGNDTIDTFASVIVSLGNNFAATESEIARVTGEVARATAQFGVSSAEAAALAATLRSIGVRAEEAGSVISKSFQAIQNAVKLGGKNLKQLEIITGETGAELKKQFEVDAFGVFETFVKGLQRLKEEGKVLKTELSALGVEGIRVAKVLPPLAANFDELTRATNLANAEVENATALNKEFERALKTTDSVVQLLENDIERLQRSIGERLTGALKIAAPFLSEVIKRLEEDPTETFSRRADDVDELNKMLQRTKQTLAEIQAQGDVGIFQRDPKELEEDIAIIQARISEINTEEAQDSLASLEGQLGSLQAQAAAPGLKNIFSGIIPGEEDLDTQIENVKERIENLKNFIAVQNGEVNKLNQDARDQDKDNALNSEEDKFNALTEIKLAQKERAAEEAEAEKLAVEAERDADFQQLEQHLGRKEAAEIIFRSKQLVEEGKQAKARKLLADSIEKAEQVNRKRKLQFESQNNKALVGLAAASANSIAQVAGASARAQFLISKAVGVAQVLINSNIAASLAIATIPPPTGEAVAAQRITAGRIQAATIGATAIGEFAQRFQDGGFVQGPSTGDRVGIRANGGEAVLTSTQQRRFMDLANGASQSSAGNADVAAALNNVAEAILADKVTVINGRELFRAVQEELDSGSEFTSVGVA